ncbi:MAG: hypothetical protein R6V56_00255 [Lentisphaeria bacterium]
MSKASEMANSQCPTDVDLSAWHDGEGENELSAHIADCETCRKKVEFYAAVSTTLRLTSEPAPDLAERIHQRCLNEQPPATIFPFFNHKPYFKVAAALAVIALVAGGVNYLAPEKQAGTKKENQTPAVRETATGQLQYGQESVDLTAGAVNENRTPLPRDNSFIRLVSSRRGNITPDSAGIGSASPPVILPQSVRHVWVVDNLETARAQFLANLPRAAAKVCASTSDKALCLRVVIPDNKLQELVDTLVNLQWALVSPALPQPGEVERLRTVQREITYVAEIVEQ